MERNEHTGNEAATIAGRILADFQKEYHYLNADSPVSVNSFTKDGARIICTVGELKTLAASALTQKEKKK